jgi:cellulose synthase/poly-beta-1,6-N-acetylglucosamine synthase-like glycosyltransferase
MSKNLTLTLIIPVYNEERHLKNCLEAIKNQTVQPDQVIVVNNNSSDQSAIIAERYDFVTLVNEPEQGLIAARNRGFEMAKGDLLARINANFTIDKNWVKEVKKTFQDQSVGGATGPAKAYILPAFASQKSDFWSRFYFWNMLGIFGFQIMWGANMVIRRSTWQRIKLKASKDDKAVHEDQDLSVLVASCGQKIFFNPKMSGKTESENYSDYFKFAEYKKRQIATVNIHKINGNLQIARKNIGKSKAVVLYMKTATWPFFASFYFGTFILMIWRKRILSRIRFVED